MPDSDLTHTSFKYSQSEIQSIFRRDIYRKIIRSAPFYRLNNIHFLGAIDYALAETWVSGLHS